MNLYKMYLKWLNKIQEFAKEQEFANKMLEFAYEDVTTYYNNQQEDKKMINNNNEKQIETIEQKIEELKQEVEKLKQLKNEPNYPECRDEYYFIDSFGDIVAPPSCWMNERQDFFRFWQNNCFKTKREAEIALENKYTEKKLRQIAYRLNNGVKIDWHNRDQYKYPLYYDFLDNSIQMSCSYSIKETNIYCLSDKFKNVAIKEIGEEKLIQYFKSL